MARQQARFVCQQCGAIHAKWTGRCDGCGAWNSLIEEFPREELPGGRPKGGLDRHGGRALGFVGVDPRGNDFSGPDGVLTVTSGGVTTLYAGDGNSTLKVFQFTNPAHPGGVAATISTGGNSKG